MTSLKDAVSKSGLATSAAKIGVTPQRLSNWAKRGVPVEHCTRVEKVLGVSRRYLRPDDYWLIWPDLPAPAAARKPLPERA